MITYKLYNDVYTKQPVSVYQLVDDVIKLSIPFDPDNTDYQQYLKWVAEGNEPLPADEGDA